MAHQRTAKALLTVVVWALSLGPDAARSAWAAPVVYASCEDSGEVVAIATDRDQVVGRISVGKRPRGVRISRDGRSLFVALSGSAKGGPGVDEATLPPPDRAADGIGVVDLSSGKLARVLASGPDPESFDLSADGRLLYVSNEETAQTSVVRVASGRVIRTIAVGAEPEGVTLRPDGRVVYVTSESENDVAVIDARTYKLLTRVKVGPRPRAVAFTPDGGTAFVTCELGAQVWVIDGRRHRPRRSIEIPSPGARPMGLAISPDGATVFVSNGRGRTVSVLDAATGQVRATIGDVGVRPWGLALSADGRKLYSANGPSNDVSVIDVESRRVVKRIPVGGSPWGLAIAR